VGCKGLLSVLGVGVTLLAQDSDQYQDILHTVVRAGIPEPFFITLLHGASYAFVTDRLFRSGFNSELLKLPLHKLSRNCNYMNDSLFIKHRRNALHFISFLFQ
jgi:hypothetical protein